MEPAFGGSNPPAPATPGGPRRAALAGLRVAVTLALLGWLLARTDLASIGSSFAGARPAWLLAAMALQGAGVALSAVRWRMLLRAKGAELSLAFLTRSLLVGSFFNNFLPSTIGGDVYRARDTARHAGSLTEAATVVLIERTSGVLALAVFALAAPLFGLGTAAGAQPAVLWGAVALLAAGLAATAWALRPGPLGAVRRVLERVDRAVERGGGRLVARALGRAERALATLELFASDPAMLRRVFLLGVLLQAAVIVHFWCVARALALPVSLGAFFLIAPAALVILLLPVSVNGIGAREAVFALLLARHGVTIAESLAFSWAAYALLLALGVVGGIVHLSTRRS